MNTLKKIGIVLVVIILLVVVVGIILPSKRHLERSITIDTPASLVFEEVNNLRNWEHWSPWRNMEPKATITYEGPEAGVGCTMLWASEDPKVGKGRQTILVSEPNQKIIAQLEFADWDGTNTASWSFEEKEGKTLVTWSHDSDAKSSLYYKYMDLLIQPQMKKSYEKGLQTLKEHVEQLYAAHEQAQKGEVDLPATPNND